jgi:hypothetical protein
VDSAKQYCLDFSKSGLPNGVAKGMPCCHATMDILISITLLVLRSTLGAIPAVPSPAATPEGSVIVAPANPSYTAPPKSPIGSGRLGDRGAR